MEKKIEELEEAIEKNLIDVSIIISLDLKERLKGDKEKVLGVLRVIGLEGVMIVMVTLKDVIDIFLFQF